MDAPHISKPVLGFFRRIVRGYFRRHFRAVRVSGAERLEALGAGGGPLIVYANHASWWDPMLQVLLAGELMPQRRHYAPMDAAALARYGIFRRIGVFGVEMETARGAAQFLRTGLRLLASGGVLWITPQGRFADVRERPLDLKPGLAALATRVARAGGGCTVLPLAVEYTFWNERMPEALLRFGLPVRVEQESAKNAGERMKQALRDTMEELQALAVARDPGGFEVLLRGRAGPGGFYELGQRFQAQLRGRRYRGEHAGEGGRERRG